MKLTPAIAALAAVPLHAMALEPVAGPRNYAGVCRLLQPVASASDALVESDGTPYETFQNYTFGIYDLAFSAETRNTVDADDLDPLIEAGEAVMFMSNTFDIERRRELIRPAIETFAKNYRCRITWDS